MLTDNQGARSLSPIAFPLRRTHLLAEEMRLDSLKRNRMLGGYDLNSGTDILREEDEFFGLIGINDAFPQLPRHHPLRRIHHNFRQNNNNNNSYSSRKTCNKDSLKSFEGIILKPIYHSRGIRHPGFLSSEDDMMSQTSIYPYQLTKMFPIERQKVYFSGRSFSICSSFPGESGEASKQEVKYEVKYEDNVKKNVLDSVTHL